MDSLRLAFARNTYLTEVINETLSLVGIAHKEGMFRDLSGGLKPVDYNDRGFYHFGMKPELMNEREYLAAVARLQSFAREYFGF